MKKHWKPLVLSVSLLCGQSALATDLHTPTELLNAIFVAFQPVDVFSSEEISAARSLVVATAAQGDPEAIVVADRFAASPIVSTQLFSATSAPTTVELAAGN